MKVKTDTRLTASFSRATWVNSENWISMKQEMMGWQCHKLDYMQIIRTLLHTDKHASTSSLKFLQAALARCSSASKH